MNDWLRVNFLGRFLNLDFALKKVLNSKKHPLTNSEVTSRILNHWYQTNIVTDYRPAGKGWSKFSFTELVWINLVIKLRAFGLGLDKINVAKAYLAKYAENDPFSAFPLLDFYILYARAFKEPINIWVFQEGALVIGRPSELGALYKQEGFARSFISLNLNDLLKELLKQVQADYLRQPMSEIIEQLAKALADPSITTEQVQWQDQSLKVNVQFLPKGPGSF